MTKKTRKAWEPDEDDFETCEKVLVWLIDWKEQNEPDDTVGIETLQSARVEIPLNVAELEDDEE